MSDWGSEFVADGMSMTERMPTPANSRTSSGSNDGDGEGSFLLARRRVVGCLVAPRTHIDQAASLTRKRDPQTGEHAAEQGGVCELATRPDRGLEGVHGHNAGALQTPQRCQSAAGGLLVVRPVVSARI